MASQLEPPVGKMKLFWIKASQLGPLVGRVTYFWIKASQLGALVGNVMFFGSWQVTWSPLLVK